MIEENPYCACGCGEQVRCKTSTYLRGHIQKKRSEEGTLTPWNKGVSRTIQEIENIRNGQTPEGLQLSSNLMKQRWKNGEFNNSENGPSQNPKAKKKIAKANHERIWKESSKQKISKARTGQPGNEVSDECKAKYSARMKINNPMFKAEVLENHPIFKSGRNYTSQGEKKLSNILTEINIQFIHQYQLKKTIGYYTADFFLPQFNKIIEFDGHFNHQKYPEKDKSRDLFILQTYGYRTLRILPIELNVKNRQLLLIRLKHFINDENKINQKVFPAYQSV